MSGNVRQLARPRTTSIPSYTEGGERKHRLTLPGPRPSTGVPGYPDDVSLLPRFGHRRSVVNAERLFDKTGFHVVVFGFQPGGLWG